MANNIDIVFRGNLRIATAEAKKDIESIQDDINAMGKQPFGKGIATQLQQELDARKTALSASVANPITQGVKDAANKIPPILKTAMQKVQQQQGGGDMWKNIVAGMLVGGTNPFMGAKFMMAAFRGGSGGGSGGGGGGMFGGMFSGAAGGNLGAALLWRAFRLATDAAELVRSAFMKLWESVKEGSKLYEEAARVGRSPGRQGILQEALGAIGVNPSQAQLLQLYGEFNMRGRGRGQGGQSVSAAGEILRAGRGALQAGEVQQIQNLGKYLDQFVKETQQAGNAFQESARQLFETNFQIDIIKTKWKALWMDMAADFSMFFQHILMDVKVGLDAIQFLWDTSIFSTIAKLGRPKPDAFSQIGGSLKGLPVSQFQRIGFGMGGFGAKDLQLAALHDANKALDKIVRNTDPKNNGGGFNPDVGLDAFNRKFFGANNGPG